jgi:hypothetical protein
MPSTLNLPKEIVEDVRVLLGLPPEVKERLVSLFETAPLFAPASSLVPIVQEAIGASNYRSGRILLAILSAVSYVEPPEWTTQRVAEEIVKAEELEISAERRESSRDFLVGMMELPPIITSAKASDLITEYERIFGDARIVTDIRPVFMEDPHEMSSGAVIVSTLKIQYQDSRGASSFYVALDTQDLEALKKVVDRALSKIETVKAELDRADLKYFTVEQGDEAA